MFEDCIVVNALRNTLLHCEGIVRIASKDVLYNTKGMQLHTPKSPVVFMSQRYHYETSMNLQIFLWVSFGVPTIRVVLTSVFDLFCRRLMSSYKDLSMGKNCTSTFCYLGIPKCSFRTDKLNSCHKIRICALFFSCM